MAAALLATLLSAEDTRETDSPSARIILFVPDESEMPPAWAEKLRSIALRTEHFFADSLEEWGWEVGRREIFSRNPEGEIEINVVRGTLPETSSGRDGLPSIMKQAITETSRNLGGNSSSGSFWWVFYHCPDHEVTGFQGAGGRDGGRAINAYPIAEGDVTSDIDLASKEMWALNMKGCIHEFGHALGLPHIGPKLSLKKGNSLMGPINKAFAAKAPGVENEPRVYLSEASAAMLAKHPLFAASGRAVEVKPFEINVSNLTFDQTSETEFKVKGRVMSDVKPHTVVVLDSQRAFGDYWTRSYCAKVDERGEFSVTVDEPFDSPRGILAIFFCLEDGRNTATGRKQVLQGDRIEIRYEGKPGERKFSRQAPTMRPRRNRG
ncbi:MAG: hypothetical protein AAGA58_03610 [Verrucomicrobiota bacterium]